MKLKYKGPLISISGGVIAGFSKHINLLFEQEVFMFFFLLGGLLFIIGSNMVFKYHNSDEYKEEKAFKNKQPWE